jgi:hypothetical protein
MAKKSSKKTKPKSGTKKKAAGKSSPLSLGPIHAAMQQFVKNVDASRRTEPHLLAAKVRIGEMLASMPRCFTLKDERCKDEYPPEECGFVPIAPK